MKKIGVLLLGILFLSVFAISFVSAEGESGTLKFFKGVGDFFMDLGNGLEPFLKYTLGSVNGDADGSLFVVKVLLFILMLAVVKMAVTRVPGIGEKAGVVWIVTIVVSILATRFLGSKELVELVWLPSGVVGIALTSLIPFVIYFFFIQGFSESRIIRRAGWALFIVLFIALTAVRWDKLASADAGFNLAFVYICTAALAFASFIWDGTIRKILIKAEIQRESANLDHLRIAKIQEDIEGWRDTIANSTNEHARKAAHEEIEKAKKRIEDIAKTMGD
ncbi:MAG: hypothetical protein ABH864_05490 [archaeon]